MKIRTMLAITTCFVALAATTAFAQTTTAQGTKSSGPTLTKDTENLARSAVFSACSTTWTNASGLSTCDLITVPAGKRLVIEHASTACSAEGTARIIRAAITFSVAQANQSNGYHWLVLNSQPLLDNGASNWTASQPMRAYSDPGTVARGWAVLVGNPDPSSNCYFAVTGYLVDVQ